MFTIIEQFTHSLRFYNNMKKKKKEEKQKFVYEKNSLNKNNMATYRET